MENNFTKNDISISLTDLVKLNIQESVLIKVLEYNINYPDYRLLAEWLGCYQYIPADSRKLHIPLVNKLIESIQTSTDLFIVWLLSDIIVTSYTEHSQKRILSWIKDSNYSLTHH